MKKILIVIIVLISLIKPAAAWNWKMPKDKFKEMNTFQRAQYNKGVRLYDKRQYRAAASEFEKFTVNFEDASVLPYIIFLRGYSLHQAKDRHKAIKVYNKVLDFFGEDIYAAAPALYHLGKAHFDNGDIKKGLIAMKEMAEDVDYQKHPLAAGALRSLADNYWKNKDYKTAVKYWKQIVRDFTNVNWGEVANATRSITAYYLKKEQYQEYEKWYLKVEEKAKTGKKVELKDQLGAAKNAFNVIHRDSHNWFTTFQKKEKNKCFQAFWNYYKSKKSLFEKSDDLWDYYSNAVLFLSRQYENKEELKRVVMDALKYINTLKDKSKNDDKYAALIRSLREGRQFDLAQHVINKMTDRVRALWEEYYILRDQNEWKRALTKLSDIEKRGADKDKIDSKWQQGYIYQHRLHQYDKAIKVYKEIAKPPQNLWEIQNCYFRMGNIKETMRVLGEIEGSFPNDAPRAAFRRAQCYKEAKQNKKAVAAARKVLKKYPKSQAASQAHQLLEEFGVATGGGVIDND